MDPEVTEQEAIDEYTAALEAEAKAWMDAVLAAVNKFDAEEGAVIK